jgi:hypothetical protein
MYNFSDSSTSSDICSPPPDVCLLLRAHAEQLWLSREIVPVLDQLSVPGGLPEEQLGAALAYLEVVWLEACRLGAETEGALATLEASGPSPGQGLTVQAHRYHEVVMMLREAIGEQVRELTAAPAAPEAPEAPGSIACASEHRGS